MDCVYICRSGDNEELRYSLRSIEKNLSYNNVWIVGDAPSWYRGNILRTQQHGAKYTIARVNLYAIANSDEISEDFILMNDDFFVMQRFEQLPAWHGGSLEKRIKHRMRRYPGAYNDMLRETYSKLHRMGVEDILDYELHVPMVMTKTGLKQALEAGGLWRSMYGNTHSIGGEEHQDVKIYTNDSPLKNNNLSIEDSPFLSTTDDTFTDLLNTKLRDTFMYPSQYESSVLTTTHTTNNI